VKLEGGVVTHQINEVEVICLPQDLPEYIEVDMCDLGMVEVVHLSDLIMPKGVTVAALIHGEDHDLPVAAIHKPRAAKVDDDEETEEDEEAEKPEKKGKKDEEDED
jgi:large subunit ribosomal protein L25